MENLDIKVLEVIEKSKPAQTGGVRTRGEKEYIKIPKDDRGNKVEHKDDERAKKIRKENFFS